MTEDIITYLIRFLIGEEHEPGLSRYVGYTNDPLAFGRYRVVIQPSGFFNEGIYGTERSMPQLPLAEIAGVPLLFGEPSVEWVEDTLLVKADIIASAYFLLTRYEEIRRRDIRDTHGRFPGKESLPYRAGFIDRPIVDEYGRLLRDWLRQSGLEQIEEFDPKILKIWLTHDIDIPFFCRSLRSLVRESLKGCGPAKAWQIFKGPLTEDPYYTLPWLSRHADILKRSFGDGRCETLLFLKAGGKSQEDKPHYPLWAKDIRTLIAESRRAHYQIGLHSSYDAGIEPALIGAEKATLEKYLGTPVRFNRHHFLASREPEDLDWLEREGFTDDFTMGYADVAGFRLGTARPVRWINPENRRLSSLTLHPLTIMDRSLNDPRYMGLTYNEALIYCSRLITQAKRVNGELVLLWHNNSVANTPGPRPVNEWHREFYEELIRIIGDNE